MNDTFKEDFKMMADDILDRMKEIKGFESDSELARFIERPKSTLSNWRTKGTIPLDAIVFFTYKQHGMVSFDWLIKGVGSPMSPEVGASLNVEPPEVSKAVSARRFEDLSFATIPVLDVEASAGHGALVEREEVRYTLAFRKEWIRQQFGIQPEKLRIITARGDSMDSGQGREKDIHDGDMLLVNTEVNYIDSDAIYVLLVDGQVFVKRVQKLMDGSVKIISANPDYEPQIISGDMVESIRIAGRVVWVITGRKP